MTLTLKEKEKFFKNRKKVEKVILSVVKKEGLIIFGQRSVNKRLPKHLDVHTQDYDIFTKGNPKKVAIKIERKLDKKFGGNFFVSKPAIHPGTHKVKTVIGDREVADISKKPDKIKTFKRKGVSYARLSFQKGKIKQSLADPKSKFRHAKDRETRTRIKIFEGKKPTRRKTTSRKIVRRKPIKKRKQFNPFAIPTMRMRF